MWGWVYIETRVAHPGVGGGKTKCQVDMFFLAGVCVLDLADSMLQAVISMSFDGDLSLICL
jgi:hypothetical protein